MGDRWGRKAAPPSPRGAAPYVAAVSPTAPSCRPPLLLVAARVVAVVMRRSSAWRGYGAATPRRALQRQCHRDEWRHFGRTGQGIPRRSAWTGPAHPGVIPRPLRSIAKGYAIIGN